MSMEEQIMRLAVAVENLADAVRGKSPLPPEAPEAPEATKKPRGKRSAEPVATEAPVTETPGPTDDFVPGGEEAPVAVTPGIPEPTVEDLRTLAQKLAASAGAKSDAFVAFLKKDICQRFCPKEMKLAFVPAKHVGEAIRLVTEYAEKNNIGVGGKK